MYEQITIGTLVPLVGRPFIEYVCNLSSEELEARLQESVVLPENKEAALQLLIDCISRMYNAEATLDDNRSGIIGFLSDYRESFTDTVTANKIRELAGGSLLISSTRDSLKKKLVILARDAYPFYLIPVTPAEPNRYYDIPPSQLSYYSSIRTYTHPTNNEIMPLLTVDSTLKLLFPAQDSETENSNAYMINGFNGGMGSYAQASLFADSLIKQAFNVCAMKGAFSCQEFVSQVIKNLTKLKALILGREAEVPLIAGVSGIKLSEGQSIKTPWGIMRNATPIEKIWLKPFHLANAQEVEVVFETKFKLTISVAATLEAMPHFEDQRQSDREAEEKLAIVSALPQIALDRTIRIQLLASKVIPPFQSGESMSWPFVMPTPFYEVVTVEEIRLIEELAVKIGDAKYERIVISFRRLASAVKRVDITDGFIDLIIIWENLFGTNSGEVSFRIALAISKLLHTDELERQNTFSLVKRLYGNRSDIVHGSRHYSPQQVSSFWTESLAVTVKVLRKLFDDRSDLLEFTSDTRSRKLALS